MNYFTIFDLLLCIVGVFLYIGVIFSRGFVFFGEFILNFKVFFFYLIHLIEKLEHLLFIELVDSHGSILKPFVASKPILGGI